MDIASLGIKIDTSDVAKATTDLDRVVQSGEKAEKAADGIAAGFDKASVAASDLSKAGKQLAETTEDAKARLLAMAKASLDSSEYYQSLTTSVNSSSAALNSSGSSASSLAALQRRLQAESDALAGATDKGAASTRQAAAATGVQAEGLQALLSKINPVLGALQKLDDQQALLNKHKAAGNIGAEDFKAFSADIEASRQKLSSFNGASEKTKSGFSGLALGSKQARENVLQLGNALAEGNIRIAAHNILEIGTNAGASALRLALLAAPIIAVAAALGTLAYAYVQGTKEADAYNKSLILTGSYAGVSAGQLGDMARQVSATVGTTGQAAEALALLAGNGKIAGESFGGIAQAAVSMQEATGKAVSETIAEFSKLADDPVKASAALNEQYHYLTASVYSQIAALEKQGDHAGAVQLATEQYADAINERTPKILENLSFWEKAYNQVARAADNLKNIGRSDLGSDIEQAQRDLTRAQSGDVGLFQNKKEMIDFYTDRLNMLEDQKAAEADIAKYDGDQAKAQREAVTAMSKIDELTKSSLTNEQKRAEAIKDYKKQLDDIRKVDPKDSRLDPAAVAKNISNLNDKFKDPKAAAGSVDLTSFNNAKAALTSTLGEYKNAQQELEAAQKAGLISQADYLLKRQAMIGNERDEVTAAYEAEISALEALKDKSGTTGAQRIQLDQKIVDARTSMVKAQKDADSQLEVLATNEEGRVKKQAFAIKTYTDALQQQAITLRQQGQRDAAGLGMGDRQKALSGQFNGIDDKANAQRIDLANQYGDGSRGMSLDEYNAKLKAVAQSQQELRNVVVANYDDMTSAQGSWTAGASSAWENYLESTRDVAGQTKSLFTNAFSSMEDAITQFALTGKLSFSDFAKSVLADMAKIAVRQASSSALSGLFGLAATAASSYFGGSSSTALGASQAGYSATYFPQAKGGAWSGGVQMFANGGAFTNSVVSKPTAFGMANGQMGVMGEKTEEAIMPLARDSQGRLGVRGGAGGSSSTVNVSVTVDATDGGGATPDPARLAEAIKVVCRQEIATARRNGGQLT